MSTRQSRKGTKIILTGKAVAAYGKYIKVFHEGKEYIATIRGKLLKEQLCSSPVAVGDNVEFSLDAGDRAVIEKILSRKQYLARPDALVKGKLQVIAANLDQLVIITSMKKPKFKPGLVDRFLVSAESENLKAAIVINKIDLADPDKFLDYADAWRMLGYPVIFTSAKTGAGLDGLITLFKDKSSVLAGHSGVGKSSLLNAIQPSLNLRTKEISKATGKGTHVTTSVIMYALDFGGWVTDTPGLKIFGLSGINKNNLLYHFPEIKDRTGKCRFNNCLHINEPDCAVKSAVDSGEIYEFRYLSYKRIWEKLES